jgi:UDP-N-acetylmuramoylalanine--D-glutamate ligase
MINGQDYFKGKKITVMGLGLLGRGLGDVKFLAEQGAELIVTDLKSEAELASSLKELESFPITFHLGGHQLADFRDRDLVLKAAGVPLNSPFIAEAIKNDIPVVMSTALFVSLLPEGVTTIGVTGTRGKSTTTHLIYELIKASGKRVFLGGNVRGLSTLAILPEIKSGDYVVLELDSWQLQGFGDLKLSPQIAVFTNLLPDHLNYYGGDMEKYFADKANIFKYQKAGDTLVAGAQIAPRLARDPAPSLPLDWQLKMPGAHNRENAALAKQVAETLKLDPNLTKEVIENFPGVPGRLEIVREYRGIKIYNDTTSTTPDALRAGVLALATPAQNLILIMGGADKNLDFTAVTPIISQSAREVILLPGTGTNKLLTNNLLPQALTTNTLAEAVNLAIQKAQAGDTILFSPGFASFGPPPGGFKNEFDRGDQFNELIKNLT